MKAIFFLLLLASLAGNAQTTGGVSVVDFVRIKNNRYKEAVYYYQHNWKAYRDEALKRGVIQSYQLLSVQPDSAADFHLMLVTVYRDSAQYKRSEAAFEPILQALRPTGPLLLNDVKPADFRQNLYYKAATVLFAGGQTKKTE